MTTELCVKDLLRGLKVGRMQTVGIMQVIPLVLDSEPDNRFAPPTELLVSNEYYGHVCLKNVEDKPVIVPTHATYLTKQVAQDHGLTSAVFVDGKKSVDVTTAACVQQSQGGYIQEEKVELQILPYAIREAAIKKRKDHNYGKIWKDIQRFNSALNISGSSHLEYFVQKYKDVMDQFVAEFEIIPNQVGAIILINGIVHGIERGPNPDYWAAVWVPLIRFCYGSQAITLSKKKSSSKGTIPVNVPLESGIKSLSELKSAVLAAEKVEKENAADAIRKLLNDDFSKEKDGDYKLGEATLSLYTLKNDQFLGQVFMDKDRISYASMVTVESWEGRRSWNESTEFEI